jgi:hypothetical protein
MIEALVQVVGPADGWGLELPPGGDLQPLEAAVDRAANALFFGRYDAARAALEVIAPSYPCVDKLLATIPGADEPTGPPAVSRGHPRALR